MKKVVYVCYDAIGNNAYNACYDIVVKVVATKEQAMAFEREDMDNRSYEEFEVEE
jgi:hypothetical protein